MGKLKKAMPAIGAVVLIVVAVFWFMGGALEHIEDTNGAANYNLQTITDQNMINQDIGSLNLKSSTGFLNDGVTFKSDKFTGVYRIMLTNYIFPSDFVVDVAGFTVNNGNFKMVVVNDDKIVAVIEPGIFANCRLENLIGSVSLVIAGESADFSFTLDAFFCNQYDITVG